MTGLEILPITLDECTYRRRCAGAVINLYGRAGACEVTIVEREGGS